MDIQPLKESLTPEAWQALREHFIREALTFSVTNPEEEHRLSVIPPVKRPDNPPPAKESYLKSYLRAKEKKAKVSTGRSVEFPPALDASSLAYIPVRVRGMRRTRESIALRRDLIAEILKRATLAGVTLDEILAHLAAAKFPVDSDYYTTLGLNNSPRLRSSILNDLGFFVRLGWVRKLTNGNWKWVRSRYYEKEKASQKSE